MPALSQGLPMYLSTAANIGTRLKGPAASGQLVDSVTAAGPIPSPGGFMCVQSTASVTNQIVTTSATGLANASFIYLPVTTGPLIGGAAPPYLGVGTPLVWNDNLKQLMIWSSGSVSWMTLIATTSMAAGGFTTSA